MGNINSAEGYIPLEGKKEEYKVVLYGPTRSGKTYIINKYINNDKPSIVTVGCDFVNIDKKEFNVNIFEVGDGREAFLNKTVCKNTLYMIVFDINLNSIDEIVNKIPFANLKKNCILVASNSEVDDDTIKFAANNSVVLINLTNKIQNVDFLFRTLIFDREVRS